MKKLLSIALLTITIAQPAFSMDNNKQNLLNKKLATAVKKNTPVAVKNLLQEGADANFKVSPEQTILDSAVCIDKNGAIVQLLINHGAKVNDGNSLSGQRSLHQAVLANNLVAVETLIKNGAIVDIKNNWGESPIFYTNNTHIAQCLLKAVINPSYDQIKLLCLGRTDKKSTLSLLPGDIFKIILSYLPGYALSTQDRINQLKTFLEQKNNRNQLAFECLQSRMKIARQYSIVHLDLPLYTETEIGEFLNPQNAPLIYKTISNNVKPSKPSITLKSNCSIV